MRSIFIKDMAYRKARIALTMISVACLVALILLMGGMMNGLRNQAKDYVLSVEKQSKYGTVWVSRQRSGSTFAGFSLLNGEQLQVLKALKGVDKQNPLSSLIFVQARPLINGKETKAIVVGYKKGRLGGPSGSALTDPSSPFYPVKGRLFRSSKYETYAPTDIPPREVVVDEGTGLEIGQNIELSGKPLRVVGKTKGALFVFDTPLLFMDLRTAQDVILDNIIYVNTVLVRVAKGYSASQLANDIKSSSVKVDAHTGAQIVKIILSNYVDEPMKGVRALRALLWIATGLIVGMITYVTTREKMREIGVLKAIGAPDRYVISLILKQVFAMTLAGVLIGIGLAFLGARFFPIVVLIDLKETLVVAVVTMVVCSYGGYVAAKKAAAVDPMIAFRGR